VPSGVAARLSLKVLPRQVGWAARRLGMSEPLVWIACPPAAVFVDQLNSAGIVFQRTDRLENHPRARGTRTAEQARFLQGRADLTVFCAAALFQEEAAACRQAVLVDHGVDYANFAAAGCNGHTPPADVADLPRPRAGFVGGIDAHTFDARLLVETARRLPDVQFVLVGACSLPAGWCTLPNVSLLGKRPYAEVAAYMAACDILIMPWNQNAWIRVCNPVKLKEYLAVGHPVVTTPFAELRRYAGLVRVAEGPAAFAEAIRTALRATPDPQILRARVAQDTWASKAAAVLGALRGLGLSPELEEPVTKSAGGLALAGVGSGPGGSGPAAGNGPPCAATAADRDGG